LFDTQDMDRAHCVKLNKKLLRMLWISDTNTFCKWSAIYYWWPIIRLPFWNL